MKEISQLMDSLVTAAENKMQVADAMRRDFCERSVQRNHYFIELGVDQEKVRDFADFDHTMMRDLRELHEVLERMHGDICFLHAALKRAGIPLINGDAAKEEDHVH